MMKFDKTMFQSQYKSQTPLSPYLCGIACLTMALKYYNQIPHNENLLSVFEKYISTGKNNVPYTTIDVNVKDKKLQVPIIYYPKASPINTEDEAKICKDSSHLLKILNFKHKLVDIKLHFPNPSTKYIPSFSLWYGFDHRGITPFITKYKYSIQHELIEDSLDTVLKKINENPSNTAILSVNPVYIGISPKKQSTKTSQIYKDTPNITHQDRHDIFLLQIINHGGIKSADPAQPNYQNGIKIIALKTLKLAYTGHASIFIAK